jgi:cytochrome P450
MVICVTKLTFKDWTPVQIYQVILKVIARISNRVFVSEPVCRNEEWIKMGLGYSDSVTLTVMILRCFPPMLHPLVAMFLPSAWKVQSNLRNAKKFLTPIINARQEAEQNQPGYQKPTDVLQWMMDAADITEHPPDKLAHRLMILVLGSVHTTTMAASHAMYDMCAIPEYFAPLRAEILDVLKHEAGWQKNTISKMLKLDSFLKESQRISPASLRTYS